LGLDPAFTVHLFRRNCSLNHDRAHSLCRYASHFAGRAVELLRGFTLHLEFHLRVLLHDLRVSLAQHLRYPSIRYSSCTQPCGISGSKVVNAEIGHLRTAKRFAPNRLEGGLVSPAIAITQKEKLALAVFAELSSGCCVLLNGLHSSLLTGS